MRTGILLFFTTILFTGCSKDPGQKDTVLPVVTISSPAAAQVFTAGQTIPINGSITDDQYIAEVHIHVANTNTGALLMDIHLYPASQTTTFNQSIIAASGINYRIQVIAKDKAVNEGRSTVEVACN